VGPSSAPPLDGAPNIGVDDAMITLADDAGELLAPTEPMVWLEDDAAS